MCYSENWPFFYNINSMAEDFSDRSHCYVTCTLPYKFHIATQLLYYFYIATPLCQIFQLNSFFRSICSISLKKPSATPGSLPMLLFFVFLLLRGFISDTNTDLWAEQRWRDKRTQATSIGQWILRGQGTVSQHFFSKE